MTKWRSSCSNVPTFPPGELKLIFSSGTATLLVPVEQTNTTSSVYRKAVEPGERGNTSRVACRVSLFWGNNRITKDFQNKSINIFTLIIGTVNAGLYFTMSCSFTVTCLDSFTTTLSALLKVVNVLIIMIEDCPKSSVKSSSWWAGFYTRRGWPNWSSNRSNHKNTTAAAAALGLTWKGELYFVTSTVNWSEMVAPLSCRVTRQK